MFFEFPVVFMQCSNQIYLSVISTHIKVSDNFCYICKNYFFLILLFQLFQAFIGECIIYLFELFTLLNCLMLEDIGKNSFGIYDVLFQPLMTEEEP